MGDRTPYFRELQQRTWPAGPYAPLLVDAVDARGRAIHEALLEGDAEEARQSRGAGVIEILEIDYEFRETPKNFARSKLARRPFVSCGHFCAFVALRIVRSLGRSFFIFARLSRMFGLFAPLTVDMDLLSDCLSSHFTPEAAASPALFSGALTAL